LKRFTRRELLAAFLGAPLAAACRGERPARLAFDGAIAGDDDALGHLVRDGVRPPPTGAPRRVGVAIVGGGLAGLFAAWRLARAGVEDFTVLELGATPGGTSRAGRNGVTAFPWGAHYLPVPLPHARAVEALVLELGAAERGPDGRLVFDEAQLCRAPQERLFVGDRWYEGLFPRVGARPWELEELARFEAEIRRLSERVDGRGRRAFAVPWEHGSDDADVVARDRLSMAEWLDRAGLRSPRLHWFVEYGCRDDYGTDLQGTSAWAALHYHASRTEHGGPDDLLTWPEGNARIADHLARRAGARLRTGALVTSVEPAARGAAITVYLPHEGRSERIVADDVVLAVPRRTAARLLPHPRLAADAGEFRSGAWLTANVTLRRRPSSRGFPEAWDNVLYGSRSLGYVVATHQLDRHGGAPGATVYTWYLSLVEADERTSHRWLEGLGWRDAAELVVTDLRRAHPDIEGCIERLDVWRWGHAMIRPRPGFVFGEARRRAAEPIGDVHFAHSDVSGLPLLEEAQYHGVRAAEAILLRRGVHDGSLLGGS
jgi:protoporphyrinogen oxidase